MELLLAQSFVTTPVEAVALQGSLQAIFLAALVIFRFCLRAPRKEAGSQLAPGSRH